MRRVRSGDSVAFCRLYEKYFPLATAYAVDLSGRGDFVRDIVKEAFARLWDRRQEYREQAKVKTYIFGYIHNVCSEEKRRRTRQRALVDLLSRNSSHRLVASVAPEMTAILVEKNGGIETREDYHVT